MGTHLFSSRVREDSQRQQEKQQLISSLSRTRAQLQQAYSGFNLVSDQDLVESYVFEIKSLQSRYDYLFRRIKELERGI